MSFDLGPAILFCPADRPERYAKAITAADAVIIDLEDAVAPSAKQAARQALIDADPDPARVIVRVNPAGSADFSDDLEALQQTRIRIVMLAKTESARDVSALGGQWQVIALCETAAGVVHAPEIAAHDDTVALMWGAEDLIASLGGTRSRHEDGRYRHVARTARSSVLLAAGAYGKVAVDAVYMDIADLAGLNDECDDAVASGFGATACIHPGQVATIRHAYAPTQAEIGHAQELLQAAEDERGAFQFKGRMIDEVMLRHARRTLDRGRKA